MINKIDNKKSAYNAGIPIATTAAGAATGYLTLTISNFILQDCTIRIALCFNDLTCSFAYSELLCFFKISSQKSLTLFLFSFSPCTTLG